MSLVSPHAYASELTTRPRARRSSLKPYFSLARLRIPFVAGLHSDYQTRRDDGHADFFLPFLPLKKQKESDSRLFACSCPL